MPFRVDMPCTIPKLTCSSASASFCPRVAQQLEHLEELRTVQVLLRGNHIDHLVKVVLLVPRDCLRNVARQVQRRAVLALNDGLFQLVLAQVGQQCPVLFPRHKVFRTQLSERVLDLLLVDLRLATVLVKVHVQTRVRLLVLLNRQRAETLPLHEILLHTVFHPFEELARLFVDLLALAALFGRKLVDLDVHIEQVLHRVRLQLLLVAKATPAERQQTKLLAPVTQVVQALHVPAIGLVQIRQERTDDRATQMTSVEGLRDIRRRELYQARLALACIVRAVRRLLLAVGIERCTLAVRQRMHGRERQVKKRVQVHMVQHRGALLRHAFDVCIRLELVQHLGLQLIHLRRQTETRQHNLVVALLAARRHSQKRVLERRTERLGQLVRNGQAERILRRTRWIRALQLRQLGQALEQRHALELVLRWNGGTTHYVVQRPKTDHST